MKKNAVNTKKVSVKERIKGFYHRHEKVIKIVGLAALSAGCTAVGVKLGLWLGDEDKGPNGFKDFHAELHHDDKVGKYIVFMSQEKVNQPGHVYATNVFATKQEDSEALEHIKGLIEEVLADGGEEVIEEVSK